MTSKLLIIDRDNNRKSCVRFRFECSEQNKVERVCKTEQAKYQPKLKMIAKQMGCRPYYDPGQCVYIFEPLLPLKH